MSRIIDVQRWLGESVRSVIVLLWFYQMERKGEIISVVLDFSKVSFSFLGFGDGSIQAKKYVSTADAKGEMRVLKKIEGLRGEFQSIKQGEECLTLAIDDQILTLTNYGDEIVVY